MAREYSKVLVSKGITPNCYGRDLTSPNVTSFELALVQLRVQECSEMANSVDNWLVGTKVMAQ